MAGDVSSIPVQNIYFLLCYAWNELQEEGFQEIQSTECETLRDLFAVVLTNGMGVLHKRGLHREYVGFEEDLARLRGKINVSGSVKRFTWLRGQMLCAFDELNHDVIHNQILKSSLQRLARTQGLSKESIQLIRGAEGLFRGISEIHLSKPVFRRVQFHSNIQHYRFLINICELIFDATLPTEDQGPQRFRDFLRDSKKMPMLFEKFVRNFYKYNAKGYQTGSRIVQWDADEDAKSSAFLPVMHTDVTLESPDRKIIIDCKFYKEVLGGGQYDPKFYSGHLYQILAYLRNQATVGGWDDAEGILLYPSVACEVNFDGRIEGHRIRVCTIDLDQPWKEIHRRLMEFVGR